MFCSSNKTFNYFINSCISREGILNLNGDVYVDGAKATLHEHSPANITPHCHQLACSLFRTLFITHIFLLGKFVCELICLLWEVSVTWDSNVFVFIIMYILHKCNYFVLRYLCVFKYLYGRSPSLIKVCRPRIKKIELIH